MTQGDLDDYCWQSTDMGLIQILQCTFRLLLYLLLMVTCQICRDIVFFSHHHQLCNHFTVMDWRCWPDFSSCTQLSEWLHLGCFCANSTIPELEQSGYKGKLPIIIYTSALAFCTFTSHSLWKILVWLVEEERLENSQLRASWVFK